MYTYTFFQASIRFSLHGPKQTIHHNNSLDKLGQDTVFTASLVERFNEQTN